MRQKKKNTATLLGADPPRPIRPDRSAPTEKIAEDRIEI